MKHLVNKLKHKPMDCVKHWPLDLINMNNLIVATLDRGNCNELDPLSGGI